MSTDTNTKKRVHKLVDQLGEDDLQAAERILSYLYERTDPVFRALVLAREEDELVSEGERRMLAEADEAVQEGKVVDHEEAKRELGL